ncbi:aspartate kinase [Bacillus salacetis]|uniref:Aspartokinase n=1 Tax=Bacillus salacetis TaxID=2315464 RepID=A0A3A1QQF2_9BACI|nr:aspartate kinase [Bacillus salacetis]RIW29302.1 aspartate kinase [Bacillus salacetis]
MKITVQKFGGTSVRDEAGRTKAAGHVLRAIQEGYKVVVVVSAMGRKGEPYSTDTLLSLINGKETKVSSREQDILLSCGETISTVVFTNLLREQGIKATALTGAQAGFLTNSDHTNAKIINMNCNRLLSELEENEAVVVAGFQGLSPKGEVTTIGRGGSDTSAAALGAALKADWVDIFTDVEGIMTADPRVAEKARPLSVISYNEVCNLANQGAKVIHPRAVEIAMDSRIPIRIRSTYSDNPGTLVTSLEKKKEKGLEGGIVTGIAHVGNLSQIKVSARKDQYNLQSEVFKAMANENISVDFINISPQGVVYTVPADLTSRAFRVLKDLGHDPLIETECAKVSVVGAGMRGVPGVTAAIVTALSERNIRILQSADSHTTIWVLIKENDLKMAVNALHDCFQLEVEQGTLFIEE